MTFIASQEIPETTYEDVKNSPVTPIFQGTFEYTVDNTELNVNTIANTGTITQSLGKAIIATGTTANSTAQLTSVNHLRFRPGQGNIVRMAIWFSAGVTGGAQLCGLADEVGSSTYFKNGGMIGRINNIFGIHLFSNDAIATIPQSSWDDPLDGSVSDMVYDPTKDNFFDVSFGGGILQFRIRGPQGDMIVFHTQVTSNTSEDPQAANLNFNYIMYADNGATTTDVFVKCSTYGCMVAGLTTLALIHRPQFTTGVVTKTGVTTPIALFTIRSKATYEGGTNFIDILLEKLDTSIEAASANNLGNVLLLKNATIGGTPDYNDINTTNSVMEIDVAGTTVTGGKVLDLDLLAGKNASISEDLTPFSFVIRPGDTITVVGESANSATFNASVLWQELF